MGSICRSCNAPIVWTKTENDKPMPCDDDPVFTLAPGQVVVVKLPGQPATVVRAPTDHPLNIARTPHWATCPDSKTWRKE